MDQAKRDELKKEFLNILSSIGWKVVYDLDKENQHNLYDVYMLITKTDTEEENTAINQRYVPLALTYTNELGFMHLENYIKDTDGRYKYSHGLEQWLSVNYGIDDLVATLMFLGYHLKDVYQFINGKGRFKFTPTLVRRMVDEMIMKGSPLNNVKQTELYDKKKRPFQHTNRPNLMQIVDKHKRG